MQILTSGHEIANQEHGRQCCHDLKHEHNQILHQAAWIELDEGRADGRHHDLGVEQRRDRHALRRCEVSMGIAPKKIDQNRV